MGASAHQTDRRRRNAQLAGDLGKVRATLAQRHFHPLMIRFIYMYHRRLNERAFEAKNTQMYLSDKAKLRHELGERLLELRQARALTQQQMADALELSLPGYRNYEGGVRDLPISLAQRMIDEFQVEPAWLLKGIGPGPRDSDRGGQLSVLRQAIIEVEKHLEETGRQMPRELKAKVVEAIVVQAHAGAAISRKLVQTTVDLAA